MASRYDSGKLRYDLVDPFAQEQLVKVFTMGAQKYQPHNWKKGMDWSRCIASLKRHLAEFEKGVDFDEESGLYHMAHVMWNAHCLTAYYKLHPQGDDRQHLYLSQKKIGLDIDDVICDWVGAWTTKWSIPVPENWSFSYDTKLKLETLSADELSDFYLSIPPKIAPKDIPFEPHCYITSRSIPVEITKQWLEKHGFTAAPVYSVGFGKSKLDAAKESGIDIFVDDSFHNFEELNKNGICTFLFDAPHNRRYNVGYKRIYSLKDLV